MILEFETVIHSVVGGRTERRAMGFVIGYCQEKIPVFVFFKEGDGSVRTSVGIGKLRCHILIKRGVRFS